MNTWAIQKKRPKNSQSCKKIQTHGFVGKNNKKTASGAEKKEEEEEEFYFF